MKRLNILYYGFLACLLYGFVLSIPFSFHLASWGRFVSILPILFLYSLKFFFKPAFLDKVTDKNVLSKLEIFFVVLLVLVTITMAYLFNMSIKLTSDNNLDVLVEGLTGSISFIAAITLLIWAVSRFIFAKSYDYD